MRLFLLLWLTSAIAAACVPEDPPHATLLEKLGKYRSWHLVTPQPVDMSPYVAVLCDRLPKWDPSNPHVPRVFRVYVNPTGKTAFLSKGKKEFPVGSMIVKEKFVRPSTTGAAGIVKLPPDAKPELLTAMIKREKGFDPANGDWEYAILSGDASEITMDGLKHCADCHRTHKDAGFVFAEYGPRSRQP